jgi:hypothetical protein
MALGRERGRVSPSGWLFRGASDSYRERGAMIGRPLDFVTAPLLQTATLLGQAHRPWPLPRRPWVMGQTWDDLLFAHWPVDDTALGSLVPAPLSLDRFDGAAWLGVTPFEIVALRPSFTPPIPSLPISRAECADLRHARREARHLLLLARCRFRPGSSGRPPLFIGFPIFAPR